MLTLLCRQLMQQRCILMMYLSVVMLQIQRTDSMTSVCLHHNHHHRVGLCLCNIRQFQPSSSSSSNSSPDAAAAADADRKPKFITKPRSFRIVDILTPSSRHFSMTSDVTRGHVTRRDHMTSTHTATMTSSDNEDSGGEKCVEVDDVMNSRERQVMTSGVSALGRLEQMTYSSVDDDHSDVITRHHQRHHRHLYHHRPGYTWLLTDCFLL